MRVVNFGPVAFITLMSGEDLPFHYEYGRNAIYLLQMDGEQWKISYNYPTWKELEGRFSNENEAFMHAHQLYSRDEVRQTFSTFD